MVAQKKTIKAPKSEKKAVWSILSGKQNISVIKKGKGEIKIKAQKSGSVKLQARQGKKKTIYNITVKKQAPAKPAGKTRLEKIEKLCKELDVNIEMMYRKYGAEYGGELREDVADVMIKVLETAKDKKKKDDAECTP